MVNSPNRFYRGIVHSPLDFKHPNFRFMIVDTVKEVSDEFGEYYLDNFENKTDFLLHDHTISNTFYGVYASYWIDIPKGPLKITDTTDLKEAINIAEEIMGNKIVDQSND